MSLFGNNVAESCLLYIQNYGHGHIRAISTTFGTSPGQVKPQLDRLEREGVMKSQMMGNTKIFQFDDRCGYVVELKALLEKMLSLLDETATQQYFRQRRRPEGGKNPRQRARYYRKQVFARDKGICQLCGAHEAFWEVDHKIPLCEGGKDELTNMRTVCESCHRRETAQLRKRLGPLRKHIRRIHS